MGGFSSKQVEDFVKCVRDVPSHTDKEAGVETMVPSRAQEAEPSTEVTFLQNHGDSPVPSPGASWFKKTPLAQPGGKEPFTRPIVIL